MIEAAKGPSAVPHRTSISITGLTKKYGDFYAISDISFDLHEGEVHALVGQNGAGKSTLLGVLSGRIAPTGGVVKVYGDELTYGDPRASKRAGIATIYQELTIIPNLSAVENVFLGEPISRRGFISLRRMKEIFLELSAKMGVAIPPFALAGDLSIADQQLLEIMRGLRMKARVLILDEPTASLAPPERKALLSILKGLREQGITIVYVSHHLDEVLEISDNITILRNGTKVDTQPREYWTKQKMVSMLMGREIGDDFVKVIRDETGHLHNVRDEVIRARGVTIPGIIENVSFDVRAGEIVGIGGLIGSGRTELVRAVSGLEPDSTGELWIEGKQVRWPKSVSAAMRYGIALAPEDRKHQGLVLDFDCKDNINMIDFKKVQRLSMYDKKAASSIAQELSDRFGLTRPIDTLCRNLSGGNQQKVLLSKVCNMKPKVLIVDEPTRGIDIGVKIEVLKILRQLAFEGMAVIIISSELEEVVAVSDRVIVMSKGRMVKELRSKEEISEENILHAAFQGDGAS